MFVRAGGNSNGLLKPLFLILEPPNYSNEIKKNKTQFFLKIALIEKAEPWKSQTGQSSESGGLGIEETKERFAKYIKCLTTIWGWNLAFAFEAKQLLHHVH